MYSSRSAVIRRRIRHAERDGYFVRQASFDCQLVGEFSVQFVALSDEGRRPVAEHA